MAYIENNLMNNEKIIKFAKPTYKILLLPLIWLILSIVIGFSFHWISGLCIFVTIALPIGISRLITIYSTELALTNQRVMAKMGLIKRDSFEIKLDKIESIKLDQTIFSRILNYGFIGVYGTGGNRCNIPLIDDPLSFKKLCNEEIEKFTASK